jgi:GMP synthase (glutamine-hydrolysing)
VRFLIIDGYAPESRAELEKVGMTPAARLHARMLHRLKPDAACDIIFPSDPDVRVPVPDELCGYTGIIWTGCNKSLADADDQAVQIQLRLARDILKAEMPCWGTCWGIQIMAVAAGGKVERNPNGREMGLARKIRLTPAGRKHPMYAGKADVFDAFASHLDIVTKVPADALILAENDYADVQALAFSYGGGTFWGVQYHPDYDAREVARLMVVREDALISEAFFADKKDFETHINRLETLNANPRQKSLRWQLGMDEDVLSIDMRQREFANWLKSVAAAG